MSERDNDERFAKQAKRLFDESVQGIDGPTQSKLNRGRQKALAELRPKSALSIPTAWIPAAGIAAAAVVAVVMWSGNRPPNDFASPSSASDFEILLNEDSLEMLEELEFYSWMELDTDDDANVG
jgi:hypothetical protein